MHFLKNPSEIFNFDTQFGTADVIWKQIDFIKYFKVGN